MCVSACARVFATDPRFWSIKAVDEFLQLPHATEGTWQPHCFISFFLPFLLLLWLFSLCIFLLWKCLPAYRARWPRLLFPLFLFLIPNLGKKDPRLLFTWVGGARFVAVPSVSRTAATGVSAGSIGTSQRDAFRRSWAEGPEEGSCPPTHTRPFSTSLFSLTPSFSCLFSVFRILCSPLNSPELLEPGLSLFLFCQGVKSWNCEKLKRSEIRVYCKRRVLWRGLYSQHFQC